MVPPVFVVENGEPRRMLRRVFLIRTRPAQAAGGAVEKGRREASGARLSDASRDDHARLGAILTRATTCPTGPGGAAVPIQLPMQVQVCSPDGTCWLWP
jgi:hypothetical protein